MTMEHTSGPDAYGVRRSTNFEAPIGRPKPEQRPKADAPPTPDETRRLIENVLKVNGKDGAQAIRTLGTAILRSAEMFEARCEEVAELMNNAAVRLAGHAELILKMIHDATTGVEEMQRKALDTAQRVASDEPPPPVARPNGPTTETATEGTSL